MHRNVIHSQMFIHLVTVGSNSQIPNMVFVMQELAVQSPLAAVDFPTWIKMQINKMILLVVVMIGKKKRTRTTIVRMIDV